MRRSALALVIPVLMASGCMPNPAVTRFRADYGCTSGEATALPDGAYRVEGCGIDAIYVCEDQPGGARICVPESRDRRTVRSSQQDAPRAVREARLSLEEDEAPEAITLRIAIAGSPALVYAPASDAEAVIVTSAEARCAEATLRGASGAALSGSPRDGDERALAWSLSALARFASEHAIEISICGAAAELAGTEMQTFRAFIARAGELRPAGGAPAPREPRVPQPPDEAEETEEGERVEGSSPAPTP